PNLPGRIDNDLEVSDATFQVDHLQVTGDAGSLETTRYHYMVAWSSDGGPGQDEFSEAQPALYSRISLQLTGGGGEYAYQIHGTWTDKDNALSTPFTIRDRIPIIVNLTFPGKMLNAGSSLTLTIKVDLKDPLENIRFK